MPFPWGYVVPLTHLVPQHNITHGRLARIPHPFIRWNDRHPSVEGHGMPSHPPHERAIPLGLRRTKTSEEGKKARQSKTQRKRTRKGAQAGRKEGRKGGREGHAQHHHHHRHHSSPSPSLRHRHRHLHLQRFLVSPTSSCCCPPSRARTQRNSSQADTASSIHPSIQPGQCASPRLSASLPRCMSRARPPAFGARERGIVLCRPLE
jgi:hypothetical protein